jgi:hypothetical protein
MSGALNGGVRGVARRQNRRVLGDVAGDPDRAQSQLVEEHHRHGLRSGREDEHAAVLQEAHQRGLVVEARQERDGQASVRSRSS